MSATALRVSTLIEVPSISIRGGPNKKRDSTDIKYLRCANSSSSTSLPPPDKPPTYPHRSLPLHPPIRPLLAPAGAVPPRGVHPRLLSPLIIQETGWPRTRLDCRAFPHKVAQQYVFGLFARFE